MGAGNFRPGAAQGDDMDVLVTGGTGFIGTNLCRELVERGHEVTAMARNPGESELPDDVERVAGDVTAYDSIEGAFGGRDAVIHLVALSPLFRPSGGERRHFEVHLGGTENAVRAAEEHSVKRFVQMSGVHADPDAETAYLRAKGRAEDVVRKSDLEWVISRPTVVFGEGGEFVGFVKLVTTPYVTGLPGGGRQRFQPIWVGDLVPMLADMAEDEERAGETYELGGPVVLSLREITEMVYKAEGTPVMTMPVPLPLADFGLTLLGAVGGPLGRDQARSLRKHLTVTDNDVDSFGGDPEEMTTFHEYLGGGLDRP